MSLSKSKSSQFKKWFLALFRLSLLILMAFMIRKHHERQRVLGERPITVTEVKEFFPEATYLEIDPHPLKRLTILDREHQKIGMAMRTSPQSDHILGYTGPTDVLIVFDTNGLAGLKIRHSYDTPTHVEDVAYDFLFMETWNGMSIEEIANIDLEASGIEGVSGATRTSMCVAESLVDRLKVYPSSTSREWRFSHHDLILSLILLGAICLYFMKEFKGKKFFRQFYRLIAFVYIGFISGDLLSLSIFKGWIEFDLPYQHIPGLTLLFTASVLIPATTGKPIYCGQVCPHGYLQELLSRYVPNTFHFKLSPNLSWALAYLPGLLLAVALFNSLLLTSIDFAALEAFDAYLLGSASAVSIIIAIVGLLFSAMVPMGYCKYACPTGKFLSYVRSRGRSDHFGKRDLFALVMFLFTVYITKEYESIQNVLFHASWI